MTYLPENADFETDPDILLPVEGLAASRRSFLRLAGFGVAAGVLAGCSRAPERRVVTYLEAPDGIVAGRGYRMATTCAGCTASCGVLARCRDGRPIKLEGLPEHPISGGGLCAVGQAEILSLYDGERFDGPRHGGREASWKDADSAISFAPDGPMSQYERPRVLIRSCCRTARTMASAVSFPLSPMARDVSVPLART